MLNIHSMQMESMSEIDIRFLSEVGEGEAEFCIARILFTFVLCPSSHRNLCTRGLVCGLVCWYFPGGDSHTKNVRDIILYPYNINIYSKFQVGWVQPI